MKPWVPTRVRQWVAKAGVMPEGESPIELDIGELLSLSINEVPQKLDRGMLSSLLVNRRAVVFGYSPSAFFIVGAKRNIATDLGSPIAARVGSDGTLELGFYVRTSGADEPLRFGPVTAKIKRGRRGKVLPGFVERLDRHRAARRDEFPEELRMKAAAIEASTEGLPFE